MTTYNELRAEYQALTGSVAPMAKTADLVAMVAAAKAKRDVRLEREAAEAKAYNEAQEARKDRKAARGTMEEFAKNWTKDLAEDEGKMAYVTRSMLQAFEDLAGLKAEFDDRFETDPAYAVQWADALVKATGAVVVARTFTRCFESGMSFAEWNDYVLENVRRSAGNGTSTSQMSNAVDKATLDAWVRAMKDV